MVGEIGEPVERDDHQRGGLAIHAPVSHGHREVPAQRGERGRALLLRHVAEAAARDERAWGGGVVRQGADREEEPVGGDTSRGRGGAAGGGGRGFGEGGGERWRWQHLLFAEGTNISRWINLMQWCTGVVYLPCWAWDSRLGPYTVRCWARC